MTDEQDERRQELLRLLVGAIQRKAPKMLPGSIIAFAEAILEILDEAKLTSLLLTGASHDDR